MTEHYSTLTIGSDVTIHIQNGGGVGWNPSYPAGSHLVSVINNGTILADTAGGSVYLRADQGWTNNGVIEAVAGASIYIEDAGTNNGTNNGMIRASGGGTLTLFNWVNNGVIEAAGGTVSLGGSWTSTGTLTSYISGHTLPNQFGIPGTDYGQFIIAGSFVFGGTLKVELLEPYVAQLGEKFLVIDNRTSQPIPTSLVFEGVGLSAAYAAGDGNDVVVTAPSVNMPPIVDAGGPYTVPFGGSWVLAGTATDLNGAGDIVSIQWDLDGDGNFGETGSTSAPNGDEVGLTPRFLTAGLSAYSSYIITLRVTDQGGLVTEERATVFVTVVPDLTISSRNITFSPVNPAAGQLVTIQATVTNVGLAGAGNVIVRFLDFGTTIGEVTIAQLDAGASAQVSLPTGFNEASHRLITVQVDPANLILELNEQNNEASQVLQVGQPESVGAAIVVTAGSVIADQGQLASVTGQAFYDFTTVPGTNDHPVQGGRVTVAIVDARGGSLGVFTGATTKVSGGFAQLILAPHEVGVYRLEIDVTDGTVTTRIESTLEVKTADVPPLPPLPPPPQPPGEGGGGGPADDVTVRSDEIFFEGDLASLDIGETITVLAKIWNIGTTAGTVSVSINDLFPVAGVLHSFQIDTSTLQVPARTDWGFDYFSFSWTNTAEGAHVIQAVVVPQFPQPATNDAATRLIFVGTPPADLNFARSVELLVDADWNSVVTPGDTLRYTIEYGNSGGTDVTGAVILDDYAEGLLEDPSGLSLPGTNNGGVITWNLGTIAAGASGVLTYDVQIKPPGEYPLNVQTITNIATLVTEQTAPIARSVTIAVVSNRRPTAHAGGLYSIFEGDALTLDASASSDPDGNALTYSWDVNSDGVFGDVTGVSPTLTWAQLNALGIVDGPATRNVRVRVSDGVADPVTSDAVLLTINNKLPVPTINGAPSSSSEGTTIVLTSSVTDAGSVDVSTGFTYLWRVVASNGQAVEDGTGANFSFTPNDQGTYEVTLTVTDKDNGSASTSSTINITDVPPIVAFHGRRDGLMGQTLKYTMTAFDPSPTDAAAGFTYQIDWDGDGSVDQTVSAGGNVQISHIYPQPGDYVMRVRAIGAGNVASNEEQLPIAIGWTAQTGGIRQTIDKINGSTVDAAGNLYVVGEVSHNLPGFTNNAPAGQSSDAFIRKYDSAGNIVWTRQIGSQVAFFDPGIHDVATAVAVDANGIAYVVGHTSGVFPGETKTTAWEDVFIHQILSDGTLGWVRQFGSGGDFTGYSDKANAVAVDATGVYVAGVVGAALPGQPQPMGTSGSAFVRKYSMSGKEIIWTNQFGSNHSRTEAMGIATDGAGSVYLTGYTNGTIVTGQSSAGSSDAFVRRYSSTGGVDWTLQFGTGSVDQASAVTVDSSGIYVAGNSAGVLVSGQPAGGGFVRKFGIDGTTAWTRQYGGAAEQTLAVATDGSGTIYTVGKTGGQNTAGGSMIARSFASDGTAGWTRVHGDSDSLKIARAVAVGGNGVYVAGQTAARLANGNGSGYIDAEILKYDNAGNESWTRQFTSFTTGSREEAKAIVTDSAGNIYVAGTTDGLFAGETPGGQVDWFLGKYSPTGMEIWIRQLGNRDGDDVGGLTIDASGAIYVAGYYALNNNAQVRRFDSDGNQIWSSEFGSPQVDWARGIAADASGSVYVSGFTRGAMPSGSLPANIHRGGADAFVTRLRTSDGVVLWTSQFGTTSDDRSEGIAVDSTGLIVVAGSTRGALPGQTSAGDVDAFVRKLNADGSVVWTRQFGTGGFDSANALAVDSAGSIYVGGDTQGFLAPQAPASGGGFVRKYTSAGGVDWTRQIVGGWYDYVYGLAADTTGVYVAGTTDGELPGQTSSGGRDAFVLKYNALGTLTWTRQWGTGSSDAAFGVAVSAPNNVFAIATSDGVFPNGPIYQDQDIVVAQFRVSVPDPTVAGRTNSPLTITGTAGDDLIVLDPGTLTNSIRVTINGAEFGTFQYPRGITVLGGLGDDTIVVNTIAATGALLDGQEGSDVYITNLQGVRGLLRIADSGTAGEDRKIVNATAVDDYVDKRGNEIKWWLRGNSPESNPINPPTPLATITSSGIEKTTIQLGEGSDFILDPGEDTELIGGRGNDTFVITETTGSGIRIEDREGTAKIVLELGGLAGPVTIDVEGSLSPVHVLIVGTDGVDEIVVSETGVTTTAGAMVNFVGIVGELAIDSGDGSDIVILDNLGESFTTYDIVADNGGDLSEVQIIGISPPKLTVNALPLPRLTGRVFDDVNNDGLFNDTDAGIAGVSLQLFSANDLVNAVASTTTDVDGFYNFDNLLPGNYRIVAPQPDGFLDGTESAGSLGGTVDNTQDSKAITGIPLVAGDTGVDYNFAEIRPSRLQALVWEDFNNDGEVNFGESAIEEALLALTGTDDRRNAVNRVMKANAQGIAEFLNLRPGSYTLRQIQPAGYIDGRDSLGTINGVTSGDDSVNDQFRDIVFSEPGLDAVNYNFGERPAMEGKVRAGQTATIGFWQNRNGQNLIRSLNGGPASTQLGDWLAATFPNMYGAAAGARNLAGMTNNQVASMYVSLFKRTAKTSPGGPPKLDAQVLATAFAVYVTNHNLAGTTGRSYGFQVTANGVGVATVSIGNHGTAFGVADCAHISVLDILLATNARTVNGLLFDLNGSGTISDFERRLRNQANDVFSLINELG